MSIKLEKILFIPTKVNGNWHCAAELELIQRAITDGKKVEIAIPAWEAISVDTLSYDDFKNRNSWRKKKWYKKKLLRNYGMLENSVKISDCSKYLADPKFENFLDNLKAKKVELKELALIKYNDWDLFSAVVSSFVSRVRDPNASAMENWTMLVALACCAHYMFEETKRLIQEKSPDRIVVFNGRFASSRPIFRACQKMGVEIVFHERGHSKNHVAEYNGHLPHDQAGFRRKLRDFINCTSSSDLEAYGVDFFEGRRKGEEQSWRSYTMGQDEGRLPVEWDEGQQNLVIFNSSEDEFVSIGEEWKNPVYSSQLEGVRQILRDLGDASSLKIWIRSHPNLSGAHDDENKRWLELADEFPHVNMIEPYSRVSSYALIDAADVVLTFGSSVGVEATYWGAPSILAGTCFYKGMDVAYECDSHEEVMQLLNSSDQLIAKPKENALQYGGYMNSFGKPFQYCKSTSLNHVTFKGRHVRGSVFWLFLHAGWRGVGQHYKQIFTALIRS